VIPTTLVRKLGWRLEVVLVATGYELYSLLQALTTGHARANSHAQELVHAERVTHLWVEPRVSHLGVVHPWLALTGGYYYELTHVGVTALTLIYLWRRHRVVYATLRSSLILISLPALVIYAAWPVAPPRLSAGVPDTLVEHNVLDAAHVHNGIVNLYAAMPSLHVAWAGWCAAAVVYSSRQHWRHLAWGYPVATTFVVLLTGNHFLLDAVAGALLAAAILLTYTPITLRRAHLRATRQAPSWNKRHEPALSR
jgi:hypothetical protein